MAFIQVVAPSSTSFLIVSMALDRYRAVINSCRSNSQIYCMIGGSWLISLFLSGPQIYGWGTYTEEGEQFCGAKPEWLSSNAFTLYMVVIFVLILIIPTTTNCFCYGRIIKRLFYDPESPQQNPAKPEEAQKTLDNEAPNQFTVTERIRSARIRTTKLALLIVVFYTLCWLPYFVTLFLMIFLHMQIPNRVLDIVEGLAMVNSCINPLVYGKYTFKLSDVEQAFQCMEPATATRVTACLGILNNSSSESRNQTYDQHFALKLQLYRQQRAELQNGCDKATST